jgi:hypothetical protein
MNKAIYIATLTAAMLHCKIAPNKTVTPPNTAETPAFKPETNNASNATANVATS